MSVAMMCVEQPSGTIHACPDSRSPKYAFLSGYLGIFDENILLDPCNIYVFDILDELREFMLESETEYAYILRCVAGSDTLTWSILIRTFANNFSLYSFPEYMEAKGWISYEDDEESLEVT